MIECMDCDHNSGKHYIRAVDDNPEHDRFGCNGMSGGERCKCKGFLGPGMQIAYDVLKVIRPSKRIERPEPQKIVVYGNG